MNKPNWFNYEYFDFLDKNKEVWGYISDIKEFSKLIELYICYISEHEIKEGLEGIITDRFSEYKNEIKIYFESSHFKLNSFNNNVKQFLNYCEKRSRLDEIIDQDLENVKKLKQSLENTNKLTQDLGCEKYFSNAGEINEINEIEKFAHNWKKESQINSEVSDSEVNRLMCLFPKTFKYVNENKLGWNLGGWSSSYE